MKRELGVSIITGDDAVEAFDADRKAEQMRRETAAAFGRIEDIFAAQGLYLIDLLQLMGKR